MRSARQDRATMRFALFRRAAPDPTHLNVSYGDETFRVLLRRRAKARRMTLRVSTATRDIVLTVPEHAEIGAAIRFADAHGGWIAARLARVPERVAFAQDALIPVRGVPHRIVHWSNVRGTTSLTVGPEGEPIIAISGETPHVARRVRELLQREARRDLDVAVKSYAGALGVPARRITVRDTKSRWGSCSANGNLNFSWRLILAPSFVLDYLAAHEVAHLKEMNHSHRFWRTVHKLCPRTEDAERWLKRHGTELHKFG
jgi:predicted metal-dependent hydrolase